MLILSLQYPCGKYYYFSLFTNEKTEIEIKKLTQAHGSQKWDLNLGHMTPEPKL